MKGALVFQMVLFVAVILLGMVQLWFTPWSLVFFIKLEITLVALLVIVYVVWFIVKENREHKDNQRGE